MPSQIKLIVGLGNPGHNYLMTRHNTGFWFIDALANKYALSFSPNKQFQAELCRYQENTVDCWLCKPQTYINESGLVVQALLHFYKVPINDVLIVHDDIDLNPGTIRLKKGGGHGGHNGLRDIIKQTGRHEFSRLRIGIGHPGSKEKVVSYVLNRANTEEENVIIHSFSLILEKSESLFKGELDKLMMTFNKKNHSGSSTSS